MREKELAGFVKSLRERKDLSLKQVARNSHGRIADSHVSRIENGFSTNVTVDKIEALADGLQIHPLELCRVLFDAEAPAVDEVELLSYYRAMPKPTRGALLTVTRALRKAGQ